ncbi:MFS transporter [Chitinasiproducens palmae]|uniref:Sugar phosphate permease n=1 Tax=Chitinasiproducens palmae TaxID=1770053 RepID=A0A1H2PJX4_9BURK|nr:MFS transporter [Chitinasiproducens palmae]SDV46708.1 Sugar phosphate permease [Chitinasiproducens palmae]
MREHIEDPQQQAEQAVIRKVAWRFLPMLIVGYLLNYLDRSNIGFAALTMNRELGLTASQFGLGAGLFFVAYCICEIPSNVMLFRVGARLWLARIMITWGLLSALMAFVVGPYSYYGARVLLGMSEAGFFPGVTFFLSSWFPAKYRTSILAWFLLAIPLSSLIGGPLSGSLLYLDGWLGMSGWKWMFVLEGTPTALVGIWALYVLADSPAKARWLTPDERELIQRMLASEQREKPRKDFGAALRDPRVHLLALIQFGFTVGSYGVGIWLPQILKQFLSTPLEIGLVSAIPYAFASVGMLLWARRSDRSGNALGNLAASCAVGAIGLACSVFAHGVSASMVGLTIALIGVTAARAIFWAIPGRIMTGIGAAAGFAYINCIAALGGFAGPYVIGWAKERTGSFTAGLVVMAVVLTVTVVLVLPLHLVGQRSRRAAG